MSYYFTKFEGSDDELTRFCFDIYDLNEDGFISREEMMLLLKDCMLKPNDAQDEEGDEGVKVGRNIIKSFKVQ